MAFLLAVYLVLHLCVGLVLPLQRGFKPYFFIFMGNIGHELERRLNRESRPQGVRFIRGVVVAAFMGLIAYAIGMILTRAGNSPYGFYIHLFFLSLCINFMTPLKLMRRIIHHLGKDELPQAIAALQPYLKESLAKADTYGVIRRSIEFIAISLNQFLVAPCLWFAVAGPVGLSVYVTFAAMRHAFGLSDERYQHFGHMVRIFDVVLNMVPALLTSILLAIAAAFVSKSNPVRAIKTIFQQNNKDYGTYQTWLVAAIAGGLGITLGGPAIWIGPRGSSARLSTDDLKRAVLLQYVLFICTLGILSGISSLKI